jgi:hypothetical protein
MGGAHLRDRIRHLAECSFVIYALKLLIEMEGIYSEYLICIMPLFAEAGD